MRDDVDELRAEVRSRSAQPNPRPRRQPSEHERAQSRKNAAIARAAKDVGRGQGKVRTKAVQRKLAAEAKKIRGDS